MGVSFHIIITQLSGDVFCMFFWFYNVLCIGELVTMSKKSSQNILPNKNDIHCHPVNVRRNYWQPRSSARPRVRPPSREFVRWAESSPIEQRARAHRTESCSPAGLSPFSRIFGAWQVQSSLRSRRIQKEVLPEVLIAGPRGKYFLFI